MHQYLFRGKRKDNNQWTYGSLINDIGICRIYVYGTGESREVFPNTVDQCTGLKDKNGFDIYDGDLYQNETSNEVFRVMFISGAFVGGRSEESCCPIGWIDQDESNCNWLHVVGNIHDGVNPAAKEQLTNTMINDPNTQTAEGQQAEETAALESASQDRAMEVSAEEGGAEG